MVIVLGSVASVSAADPQFNSEEIVDVEVSSNVSFGDVLAADFNAGYTTYEGNPFTAAVDTGSATGIHAAAHVYGVKDGKNDHDASS